MTKKPYHPTRTCPHRWCKSLHIAPVPFLLAILAFYLWNNWLWLLLLVFVGIASNYLQKALYIRPRPRSSAATIREVIQDIKEAPTSLDLEMEDAKYEGTGWRMLEVRKGWARVAVSVDAFIALNVGAASVDLFSNPAKSAVDVHHSTSDVVTYVSLLVGLAIFGFNAYAHKKATQPRKPKRVWLPAFLRTNV